MKTYYYRTVLLLASVTVAAYFLYNSYFERKYKAEALKELKQTYLVLINPKLQQTENDVDYMSYALDIFKNDNTTSNASKVEALKACSLRISNETKNIHFDSIHHLENNKDKYFLNRKTLDDVNKAYFELGDFQNELFSLKSYLEHRLYSDFMSSEIHKYKPQAFSDFAGSYVFESLMDYEEKRFITALSVKSAIITLEDERLIGSKWLDSVEQVYK